MSSQWEDAFNEAVERRVRMLRAAELVESWSCCGQTFTGTSDFISGVRAAHVCPPEDVPDAETAYAMGKAAAASPDERLREALRDANEYLAQIADYSPSEVADAIDSVRAQIKDALAATDSRGKPDGASVPDQSCATCGGSGDRNGNRRAADPFGTCPGCGGTGNVAAADREAPDTPTKTKGSAAEVIGTMGSSENLIVGPADDGEDR